MKYNFSPALLALILIHSGAISFYVQAAETGKKNVSVLKLEQKVLTKEAVKQLPRENGRIVVPDLYTDIAVDAFENLDGVERIILPRSIRVVANRALDGCKEKVKFEVPNSRILELLKGNGVSIGNIIFNAPLGYHEKLIASKYFETIDDHAKFFASGVSGEAYQKLRYNPVSLDPESVGAFPNIQTLHLYTMEDVEKFLNYEPQKSINKLEDGLLKDAEGKFFAIVIHAPMEYAEAVKKVARLENLLSAGDEKTSGRERIKFLNVTVHKGDEIGNVDSGGRFIFNDDIYTGDGSILASNKRYVISGIAGACFKNKLDIKSIIIPDGVRSIGMYAFSKCSRLTSVEIPGSVQSIGMCAFSDCRELKSVTVPGSVQSIGVWAFMDCRKLKSVTISNGVQSIGSGAFRSCEGLTSVRIPGSVQSIGEKAFLGCNNAKFSVQCEAMRKYLSEYHGIAEDRIIVNENAAEALWNWPNDGVVRIPDGIEHIHGNMLRNRGDIKSISIPNSVQSIGVSAFEGCRQLESVEIPGSVQSIGDSAFAGCTGLTSITIPGSVQSIRDRAFAGCKNAKFSVPCEAMRKYLSEYHKIAKDKITVDRVSDEALRWWPDDGEVQIPEGIEHIHGNMLRNRGDIKSISIPNSVQSIGRNVFFGCTQLDKIYVYSRDVEDLIIRSSERYRNKIVLLEEPRSEQN